MTEPADAATAKTALARMHDVPFLGDFARPFPRLGADGTALRPTFEQFGRHLGKPGKRVVVLFRLTGERGDETVAVTAGPDGSSVDAGADAPDLEVLLTEDTWRQIAGGRLSPLEAFGRGRLRVRGPIRTAHALVARLADPKE